MRVKDMIKQLNKFDQEFDVVITDGYDCKCYSGDFLIVEFEGSVDIGIGGCQFDPEGEEEK